MVSKLRLCSAIQSASASASATVVMASTSTASYSPKINVDVAGSKPSGSPKGFGRSPTIAFPGAVKMFTLSMFDATGPVTRVVSFGPSVASILYSLRCQSERPFKTTLAEARRRSHWTNVSTNTKASVEIFALGGATYLPTRERDGGPTKCLPLPQDERFQPVSGCSSQPLSAAYGSSPSDSLMRFWIVDDKSPSRSSRTR